MVVTDGFTGNVALKTLEGSLRFLFDTLLGVFGTDEATRAAARSCLPHLLPLAAEFEPENTGGAMLLGIDGVCVISHGSSNATAMMNAVAGGPRVRHPGPGRPRGGGRRARLADTPEQASSEAVPKSGGYRYIGGTAYD